MTATATRTTRIGRPAGLSSAQPRPLIELADGRLFDPLRPDPALMDPENIAVSLGNACRFGCQVTAFYSVAQHSVLVALLAPQDMPAQRMALLHDAEEGFGLPDMPKPLKPFFPDYVAAQAVIAEAVHRRYGLLASDHARIKPADRLALDIEKTRLKSGRNIAYWKDWASGEKRPDWLEIDPLGPAEAAALFRSAHERIFTEKLPITRDWIADRPGFRDVEREISPYL
jgi:uncharacterized protein